MEGNERAARGGGEKNKNKMGGELRNKKDETHKISRLDGFLASSSSSSHINSEGSFFFYSKKGRRTEEELKKN